MISEKLLDLKAIFNFFVTRHRFFDTIGGNFGFCVTNNDKLLDAGNRKIPPFHMARFGEEATVEWNCVNVRLMFQNGRADIKEILCYPMLNALLIFSAARDLLHVDLDGSLQLT